ncbi:MAG TPA: nucleotidyltransferase [Gammaproteobacteria bacterium]|nr:nucleotidyltransferase [Gammaproteobacteria bacterium]
MLNKHFREFLKLLIDNGIKFVVVGGYAVGIHGFPRYTGDLDVFVAFDVENAARLKHVFELFGFGDLGLSEGDFRQANSVIEIGREPTKIQVLTGIDGVTFADAYANRIDVDLDGLRVPFLGFEDLLKNKKASARSKDLIDVDELERIKQTKPADLK